MMLNEIYDNECFEKNNVDIPNVEHRGKMIVKMVRNPHQNYVILDFFILSQPELQ